jgi:Arc/MetJ-type ribon-helix-helix transcriptional regulator
MSQIQMNLPDPITEFAGAQVSSGRFTSVEDYVSALVTADRETQELIASLKTNPRLPDLLEEGINSGPGRIWSAEYLAELKQQVYDRAAQKGS